MPKSFLSGFGVAVLTLWVTPALAQPTLSVDGVTLPGSFSTFAGSSIPVGISDGPGNPADWIGLYVTTAPDSSPVAWKYLNGATEPSSSGATNATLTFLTPTSTGDFEFRFFANNGFARLATSVVITVSLVSTSRTIKRSRSAYAISTASARRTRWTGWRLRRPTRQLTTTLTGAI